MGGTFRPCPPEHFNGFCRYDFNASLLTLYNGADRASGMVVGNLKINNDGRHACRECRRGYDRDRRGGAK